MRGPPSFQFARGLNIAASAGDSRARRVAPRSERLSADSAKTSNHRACFDSPLRRVVPRYRLGEYRLESGAQGGGRGARPERQKHDSASLDEAGQDVALLGRQPGRVVQHDAETTGQLFSGVGDRGQRSHIDVELERPERLLDDGCAACRHRFVRRVRDDGESPTSHLGQNRRSIVVRDRIRPGKP
jgi:hypothetical protein